VATPPDKEAPGSLTRFTTIGRPRWVDASIEVGAVMTALSVVFLPWTSGPGPNPMLFTMAVAGAVVLSLVFTGSMFRWLRRPGVARAEVTLGDDGFRLGGRGRPTFVSYHEIEEITVDPIESRVVIRVAAKRSVSFRVTDAREVADALETKRRMAAARQGAEPLSALRREGREVLSWGRAARALLDSGGLREGALTPQRLVELAEDGDASVEQRIGAALALADAPEPLRVRVRVAAEGAARPHLAQAMTEAVDGEVDVEVLEKALGRE